MAASTSGAALSPGSGLSAGAGFGIAAGFMDILGGLFGYFSSLQAGRAAQSKARLIRAEAEYDAIRYGEKARNFKASQTQAYLKSGVKIEGSPLDILDETSRVAQENMNAIRARGAAQGGEYESQASALRNQGRGALISGISSGVRSAWMSGAFNSPGPKTTTPAAPASWGGWQPGFGSSVEGMA